MAVGQGIENRALLARRVRQVHKESAGDTGKFGAFSEVNAASMGEVSIASAVAPTPSVSVAGNAALNIHAEGKLINRILLVALVLGGSVDVLFYKKATGVSALVFVGLIVGALVTLGVMERVKVAWRNVWLVLPLVFFAGMVSVRANPEITLMNLGAASVLLLLFIYFFTGGRVEALGMLGYPLTVLRMMRESLRRPTPVVRKTIKQAASNPTQNRRIMEITRGLVIAIPILLLFTFLLSQADSIFQSLVSNVFQFRFVSDTPEAIMRLGIILASAWGIAGAMLHALKPLPVANAFASGPATVALKNRGISYVEGTLVLALVNALFAVFGWIQFTVLFSGQASRTMDFEAYREYVRRGFGELLVVAVLTMALILGLRRAMRRSTETQERNLNLMNTLMIGLAMTLLVSAFARMVIWENIEFYISTATRLYVRTFIVCLGALFVWLLLTTWFRRDRFAIGALVTIMAFIVTVNTINPDAEVAAYNLRRNDELSTRYLYILSNDAVPTLVAGLTTTTGQAHTDLVWNLKYRLDEMEADKQWQNWQSFHFARQAAYDALVKARAGGGFVLYQAKYANVHRAQ
ncbi:MAG: DUF4173 domain-containing protein [Chloroflexia bacterium]